MRLKIKENIYHIGTIGFKSSRMKYFKTPCMYPGFCNVSAKCFTLSHLMKNDLNGHFLTDQPGQPFNWNPGDNAGFQSKAYLTRLTDTIARNKRAVTIKFNHIFIN